MESILRSMIQGLPGVCRRTRHRAPSLRRSLLALLMACVGLVCTASPAGADAPHGRACLVVEELSGNAPQNVTTTIFGDGSTPGPGKRLALYADASVDAYVLVAAFNDKDRRLTNGWPPQLVELKAWEERYLPLAPAIWEWTSPTEPFEVDVAFLERTAADIESIQNVIAVMQDPTTDPLLRDRQAKKLREEIVTWTAGQEDAVFHGGVASSAWGGTLRGELFPWPKMARKAVFGAKGRGVLIFRHGP